MSDSSENTDEKLSQLNGRIPKELKKKFDSKCKTRGLKRQYVLEKLAEMWVKGEIKID